MSLLEVQNLSVTLGGRIIVDSVSFSLEAGQWMMLIGPNGAGKSTLLHAVSRTIPYTGSVLLEGTDLHSFRPAALARKIGVLSQQHSPGYAFTVAELVRMGRYAYSPGIFSRRPADDERFVEHALELTGMRGLADQSVLTLSGGELQRAFLAQVFAQDPKILLLDEPTNHLDLIYQKQIFGLIRTWLETSGGSVLSVVHDLSLARCYGSHALLLDQARSVACGTVSEVFQPEKLNQTYGMDVSEWMKKMLRPWTEDRVGGGD